MPIELGSDITWSPGLSFTNNTTRGRRSTALVVVLPGGALDTVAQTGEQPDHGAQFPDRRSASASFNWQNSVQVTDATTTGRDTVTLPGR